VLTEIWRKLLEHPPADRDSNFFSLAGDSLLAIQCVSALREKLPVVLSLSDFFENPTIAQQAALIRHRLRPEGMPSPVSTAAWEHELLQNLASAATDQAIPPGGSSDPCPLSRNQRRIWFMEQLTPGVPVYN